MPDIEFVIVGAGFAGAATAYHLRRLGAQGVVLLEQEPTAGFHSSGRNACLVRAHTTESYWVDLLARGAEALRRATLAPFERTGSVLIGLGDDDVQPLVPMARGQGLVCPDDGIVDVAALLETYLRGQDVRYGCRLEQKERRGALWHLETSHGPLTAKMLVNAAGPWAGRVGDLPLMPLARHVFVTGPMPDVDPHWPFVWDVHQGLYFRPESGGLLLSPCDERLREPGDYVEAPEAVEDLAERVARLQPGLGDLAIAHRWVGQRTFAQDRAPVIGFDARSPALFHVAALGGHGVTSSYAVGELAARALLGGVAARPDLSPGRLAT